MNRRTSLGRIASLIAWVLGAITLAGCSQSGSDVRFLVDPARQIEASGRIVASANSLPMQQPVALGAVFQVFAWTHGGGDPDPATPWVRSSDPKVLRILEQFPGPHGDERYGRWIVWEAVGEGTADLVAYESVSSTEELARASVTVQAPDGLRLFRYQPFLTEGYPSLPPDVMEIGTKIEVLSYRMAQFAVQYRRGDVVLRGSRALRVEPLDGYVGAEAVEILGGVDGLWLRGWGPSSHQVVLRAGTSLSVPVDVTIIDPSDVVSVDLWASESAPEANTKSGAAQVVLAIGRTSDGAPVFGMDFDWMVDDKPLPSWGNVLSWPTTETWDGSLWTYSYHPDQSSTMEARFGDLSASTNVHFGF